ncbi:recombination and DNA strand exchange inhibitor protein [Paenibacillus swuensis]|uniref:Endonuclease MutS2 n=1 Tax=Paenibacillus swuensis TaxID=1178515 RepID=A0A172TDL2_9BACL|nr:endonuclease MutS2 [Paenibacillus swuensis]ANE45024.1 recombination and DNA strand exchange inhibitor protein [Paenibacillus swuensis]
MNAKVLNTMEFPKIIDKLTGRAQTSMGKERAMTLIPSSSFEEVKVRLQATDEAYHTDRLKGSAPFGGVHNIKASLHRAHIGGMLNSSELLEIGDTLYGGRKMKRYLQSAAEEHPIPSLEALFELLEEGRELEQAIRACIDDQGDVLDSASSELAAIRKELRNGESRVRDRLEQLIRTSSIQKMLQDPIITIRNDRFVVPVKQEYRSSFGGLVHDQSGSGATLFIEPEVIVTMNNRLRELKLNEEREIEKILRMLTARVAELTEELTINVDILGELDFIFAKARLAHEQKASRPMMNDRGYLKLKKGRHPLIAAEKVVPLDLEIGNQFTSIIVTGPNTGGKTVSIKTVGLLNLMAMSGLFIPAEEGSQMCVFDAIYADIGDEQSIEQNLSTFSSHMTNIIGILKHMTPKSLIMLDELGAGTDPAEGSALAIAILEHMHSLGCRIIASTHYSELKAYAYERKGVINASMEFDVNTLSPTYRLLVGVPGRSNAFAIAERLGLSTDIINDARGQVKEEDQRVESMIASLAEDRLTAEQERITAEGLREELERQSRQIEEQRLRFEQQKDKLLEKAEDQARETLAKARAEAESIIADLRKMAAEEGAAIKDHKLVDVRRKLDQATPEKRQKSHARQSGAKPQVIGPGDEVMVYSLNQKGLVVEDVNTKEVMVQLGIMKIKVKKSDLELLSPTPAVKSPKQSAGASVKRSRDEQVRTELDLRGANLEEAIMETDQFLDEAIMSNLGQVYIIHGKGTGILRTGIQEFLRRHKHVKSYRLGEYGEGGAGITVAELK